MKKYFASSITGEIFDEYTSQAVPRTPYNVLTLPDSDERVQRYLNKQRKKTEDSEKAILPEGVHFDNGWYEVRGEHGTTGFLKMPDAKQVAKAKFSLSFKWRDQLTAEAGFEEGYNFALTSAQEKNKGLKEQIQKMWEAFGNFCKEINQLKP